MKNIKKYKYLLFDADYTLLDFNADMNIAFEDNYRSMELHEQRAYSPEILSKYEEFSVAWWGKFESGQCNKTELFHGRFVDFINYYGFDCDPISLSDSYFNFLALGGKLLDGALEMVKKLSENYTLYIVTNGNAVSQKPRLERSGLLAYVEDYFVSETVGAAKPSKKYFDYVFEKINLADKSEAIIIGDSILSDILGAVNAGIDSIWYNPTHIPNPQNIPFTHEVGSFEEILRVLW